MTMVPDDVEDENTTVNEINKKFREHQNEVSQGNQSQANNSKITHPDEDNKKLQVLNSIIDNKLEPYRQDLSDTRTKLDALIAQLQQAAQMQQEQMNTQGMQGAAPTLNDIPAEAKAEVLSKLGTSLAQIIQAWKGNTGGTPTQADPFGEMFKQLGINIMQAGVDGIYKQVYDGYQPQPRPNPLSSATANNNPQERQNTGFR